MNQLKPFNIVFCIDDNFAPHLAALLSSIIANTDSQNRFHFHVCSAVLSEQNQLKLKQAVRELDAIEYYPIDSQRFENIPISRFFVNRISIVTYFRLIVPELLHSVTGLLLYMDADMIVRTDITRLFFVDLKQSVAGVVEDFKIARTNYWQELGLARNRYFNAGLMLIDLRAWRQHGITSTALDMICPDVIYKFNDQDILNLVLKDHVEFIDISWNMQEISLEKFDCADDVKVIHYAGEEKPWHFSCIHPFTELYRFYKAQSGYADTPLSHYIDDHDQQLIDLIVDSEASDLFIFGAGQKGRRIICFLQSNYPKVNIHGIIDKVQVVEEFNGIPVMPAIPKLNDEFVVVASFAYAAEIVKQLQQKLVPVEKIIAISDAR